MEGGNMVVAGVDTHKEKHVLCVLDGLGRKIREGSFAATANGYDQLAEAIGPAANCIIVGVEGTCSFGAGLTSRLSELGYNVVEVLRPKREKRRKGSNKNDFIDAERAARQAVAGTDTSIPKSRDGWAEASRPLICSRSLLVNTQTKVMNSVKSLLNTAPEPIRTSYSKFDGKSLMVALARKRKPTNDIVIDGLMSSFRALAKTWIDAENRANELESSLSEIVRDEAPALLEIEGCGAINAAILGIAAGDNPERMGSESSFSMLCGASPIEVSSGKAERHRLNRGGNRKANQALYSIVLNRMSRDERTARYVARRTAEGKSKREIIRCLKRYVARKVYKALLNPKATKHASGSSLQGRRLEAGVTQSEVARRLEVDSSRISDIEAERRKLFDLRDRYNELLNMMERQKLGLDTA